MNVAPRKILFPLGVLVCVLALVAVFYVLRPIIVEKHVVEIIAKTATWLFVEADTAKKKCLIINPGEKYRVEFNETLSLRVGDTGAIDIVYDGNAYHSGNSEFPVMKKYIFPPER